MLAADRVPMRVLQARVDVLPIRDEVDIDLLHRLAGDEAEAGVARGGDEIEAAADPVAKRAEIEDRLEKLRSPFRTAERFSVEDIIDPRDTRPLLCDWAQRAHELVAHEAGDGTVRQRDDHVGQVDQRLVVGGERDRAAIVALRNRLTEAAVAAVERALG